MSELLINPKATPDQDGSVIKVTPGDAGWKYVGFEVYQLKPGQTFEKETGDLEVAVVLLSGKADAKTNKQSWDNIGERMSVFDDTPAYTVYVSSDDRVELTAITDLEIAVCTAPGKGTYEARLITPKDVLVAQRGYGSLEREIHNILPADKPADSLFIFEVFTPEGNWSSYPPHKHDEDNLPQESYLEETYYHRVSSPENGFAIQRVYTHDKSLDETIVVRDGDLVLVPKGFHPVSNPPGYKLYYLNVMAGPVREWKFTNDKDHEWLLAKN
ncbi:5-deoxy-glucuronate isomerase [Oceanobacillus caeni]|uniref:5-deoxy-glucuronate isomerase n=1 Tax=Oceanobacillus caeni TaxID=405946 RepID=A0ABR5MML2_9BACI|nr:MULTISPECIES: 5-deoxy-glucuronate isomerase [Bacillaceae]KPH77899.1 5-deoxyglucuronate isomerase [Oceanobacillus caeni]MBU8789366.1 5-deoxy-glucuronate isomerase [Oceanobacillus caeni]MCR1832852.1 5-deoxy-glucuronate isomerase [Oceanobacillus caeni]MED4475083.1 5-deoxy-glucuronate isomerase [Oceanobacillus caeni]